MLCEFLKFTKMANATVGSRKKRPRLGPRYQMEVSFTDESTKQRLLQRLDKVRRSLGSNVGNYELLSSLLDNYDDGSRTSGIGTGNDNPPSKKPILSCSGN